VLADCPHPNIRFTAANRIANGRHRID